MILFKKPAPVTPVPKIATDSFGVEGVSNSSFTPADEAVIAQWYAPLFPMSIGSTSLMVSVADTLETRMQGLSGTPYLPTGVGKLFIFEESSRWGFWMKDMNYAIDIIWIDTEGSVIHIEERIAPETFPQSFTPPLPARYVVEVPGGYVEQVGIVLGDLVVLPVRE
jgi:uncharacterized membrane protein (UPF0127 family)